MTNQEIIDAFEQLGYEIKVQVNKAQDEIAKAARDGYLGDLFRTDFTVTGRGAFPIDMLRYCNAWPKDENDSRQIEDSIEQADANDPFNIRLTKYHRDATPNLSNERWESKFRWRVIDGRTETTRIG